MSNSEERHEQPATPRTPRARQIEVIRRNIAALERIGHTYAANKQRELLARLEAEEKDSKR